MPDVRKAFLADIIENIDDDAPRLVFADWLADRGDSARAEFIRLQCRLAAEVGWVRPWERHAPSVAVDPREAALIAEHGAEWREEAPRWVAGGFGFFRGFVSRVGTTARQWLEGAKGIYRRVPVEGLAFYNADDSHLAALAPRPECRYLRLLDINTQGCTPAACADFFAAADLRRLSSLSFRVPNSGPEYLAGLLAPGRLSGIRCLQLWAGNLEARGAGLLAGSDLLVGLKSLHLYNTTLAEEVAELAASPGIDGVEELSLWSYEIDGRGLAAVAGSPHLSSLRHLRVLDSVFPPEAIRALAASPSLEKLESLSLFSEREIPERHAIAESERLIHLRRLHLNNSDCSDILARLAERRRERGIERPP